MQYWQSILLKSKSSHHHLGKETVQNSMAIRFGNMLFELMECQYVDHIQITVSETVGVGDRGEYYDESGAMRYGSKSSNATTVFNCHGTACSV